MGDTSLMVMVKSREYEALKKAAEGGGAGDFISDLVKRLESSFSVPRKERSRLRKAAEAACLDDKVSFDDNPAIEGASWVNCWIQIPREGEEV